MFKYKKIESFLELDFCNFIIDYFILKTNHKIESSGNKKDLMHYFHYSDYLMETILQNSLVHVNELVGEEVYPSYTYSGIYTKGESILNHKNKSSEKIEGFLFLGSEKYKQKIYLSENDNGSDAIVEELCPGDLFLFNGNNYWHWTDSIKDEWSVVSLMHFTDNLDFIFDKREYLGFKKNKDK